MTDRDRLIELIDKAVKEDDFMYPADVQTTSIADYLLANGVIVPPCKVGDKVYFLDAICGTDGYCINNCCCIDCTHGELQVCEIDFDLSMYKEIGETVFLTKEEAEEKLEELKENGN